MAVAQAITKTRRAKPIDNPRLITHNSPFIIHNSQFTIHHSQFIIHKNMPIHIIGGGLAGCEAAHKSPLVETAVEPSDE